MREYDEQKKLIKVQCNVCKKEFKLAEGIIKEGCFHVDYTWGYFSSRDGIHHQFDLCEKCYDRLVGAFSIPVSETENTELI